VAKYATETAHQADRIETHKGSTICTSPETVLIQIVYFFSCVLHVLSTDSRYSRLPGDQAGPIFFRLCIFFTAAGFMYKLVYYNF
jgi:hypothetical protein